MNVLKKEASLDEKASMLIQSANDSGGEDNITVLILEHFDTHQAGEAP
jgi:protein phosphatase